jgi:antitoxin component YwqK of YwqJK toxin-antitoxin module
MSFTLTNITSFSQVIIKAHLVLLGSFLIACNPAPENQVEDYPMVVSETEMPKDSLILNQLEGKWYYESKPYNGFALIFYSDGSIEERIGFSEGKKWGRAQKFYKDGSRKYEAYYKANRKDGLAKNWSKEGVLIAESNFMDGVVHGVQRTWYSSGGNLQKDAHQHGQRRRTPANLVGKW